MHRHVETRKLNIVDVFLTRNITPVYGKRTNRIIHYRDTEITMSWIKKLTSRFTDRQDSAESSQQRTRVKYQKEVKSEIRSLTLKEKWTNEDLEKAEHLFRYTNKAFDLDELRRKYREERPEVIYRMLIENPNRETEYENLEKDQDKTKTVPKQLADDPYTRRLYAKSLQDGEETDRCIRINVVGNFAQGKTTLIRRIVGKSIESVVSTNGIDIDRYICKQSEDGNIYCMEPDANDQSHIIDRLCLIAGSIEKDEGDNKKHKSKSYEKKNAKKKTKIKSVEEPFKIESNEEYLSFCHHYQESNREGATKKKTKEKEMTFDIWDFAGQYTFYATHTMFHSRNAIYLLVMNLSTDLNTIIYDDEFPAETGDRSMEYFIKFWMNSIHSFCGTSSDSKPTVILVGTNKDKLTGGKKARQLYIDTYFDRVRALFDNTDVLKHIHQCDFAVDSMANTDDSIEDLKQEIIKLGRENTKDVQVPAKWIPLEKALITRRSENIITFDAIKLIDAGSIFPLEEEGQIKMFLQYHHSKGTLLFFDEEPVSKYVLLNPQYLIDAFKCIITSERFCKKNPTTRPLWNRLVNEAVLENGLIDFQWQTYPGKRFMENRNILLSFLVKNHIISAVIRFDEYSQKSEEMGWYIIPSLLKTRITPKEFSDFTDGKKPSLIRIVFLFENSVVVPTICHRLFAAALGKWPVASYDQCLLFEDFAVFRLDMYQVGIIQMNVKERAIELQVLGLGRPVYLGDSFRRFAEAVVNHEFNQFAGEKPQKQYDLKFRCNDQSHGIEGSKLDELNFPIGQHDVPCPNLDNHHIPTAEAKLEWFLEDKIDKNDIPMTTLSEQQLSKLSLAIGENWIMLGHALGLKDVPIDHINEENQTAAMKRYNLLLLWQKQNTDKATLDVLVKVMKENPHVRIDWDIIRNIVDKDIVGMRL